MPTVRLPLSVWLAAPIVPVRVGEADITTLPVPVIALDTSALLPSVNIACEAVAEENTGAAVNVATPVTARVLDNVVAPATARVLFKVVAPVTVRVPGMVPAAALKYILGFPSPSDITT